MQEQDLYQEQLKLEEEMFTGGIRRFNAAEVRLVGQGRSSDSQPYRRIIKEMLHPLACAISEFKEHYSNRRGRPVVALSYLRCIPDEVAAFITLKVCIDMVGMDVSLTSITSAIGERIEDQVRFSKLEGQAHKYLEKVKAQLKKNSTASYRHKHRVMVSAELALSKPKREGQEPVERWQPWPIADLATIGLQLVHLMEQSVHFKDGPVFYRALVGRGQNSKPKLMVSEHIKEWAREYSFELSALFPCYAPCVVPPRDWLNAFDGGFHTEEVSGRVTIAKGKRSHLRKLTRKQMPKVYEAINHLQAVEWEVNPSVLEVAKDVLRADLGLGLPRFGTLINEDNKPPCPVPEEFRELRGQDLKRVLTDAEWQQFLHWKSECAGLYTKETKRGSQALASSRLISMAQRYSAYPSLYFVYACDSRGRVYAQSSSLSPQGNSLSKALLRFKNGESLTTDGYVEFCRTGANLYGWDKAKLMDKYIKVNDPDFIEMCHDIAADPLTFKQWLESDDPWLFLAWAFEFSEYHTLRSEGRESEFRTHISNGRDGSCSGIQHYSAMMKDPVGGAAVNLMPSETKQDIYGKVGERVTYKLGLQGTPDELIRLTKDGEPDDISLVPYAKSWLAIGITRAMCKKSVMTLPYGSSQMTCRDSINEYLSELVDAEESLAKLQGRSPNKVHPFEVGGEQDINLALRYMTTALWSSIGDVVKAPVVAMKFLRKLSNAVSNLNSYLEWTTPTGFIVKQEIFETERNIIETSIAGKTKFSLLEETSTVDKAAMAGAFAPNFIHSYDASHLILAVCAAKERGIKNLHVIHDDFGTLANKTAELVHCLKRELVDMYKGTDRLAEVLFEQEERLCCDLGLTIPPQFGMDLEEIMKADYPFA